MRVQKFSLHGLGRVRHASPPASPFSAARWTAPATCVVPFWERIQRMTPLYFHREPKLLDLNQKDGTFCDASQQAGPALMEKRVSRGLAVGDLFNDGNMDAVVGNLHGKPMILRNRGIPDRHWVSFELAGVKSNRLALNARVQLIAGGMTQTEEIHSGGSYLSQNDLRVHFGLGATTKIDRVVIHWPSGAVETLTNLEADKFYSVLEGQGVVPFARIRPAAKQHP